MDEGWLKTQLLKLDNLNVLIFVSKLQWWITYHLTWNRIISNEIADICFMYWLVNDNHITKKLIILTLFPCVFSPGTSLTGLLPFSLSVISLQQTSWNSTKIHLSVESPIIYGWVKLNDYSHCSAGDIGAL